MSSAPPRPLPSFLRGGSGVPITMPITTVVTNTITPYHPPTPHGKATTTITTAGPSNGGRRAAAKNAHANAEAGKASQAPLTGGLLNDHIPLPGPGQVPETMYPAITHFTDAITALPREFQRHASLLKEVDSKAWRLEDMLAQQLDLAAQSTPYAQAVSEYLEKTFSSCADGERCPRPSHTTATTPGSPSRSTSPYLPSCPATTVTTTPATSTSTFSASTRRRLFSDLHATLSELMVTADEKNHVLWNANNELAKHMRRLDTVYRYVQGEVSEETRLGNPNHWAYWQKPEKPVRTSDRPRRGGTGQAAAAAAAAAAETAAAATTHTQHAAAAAPGAGADAAAAGTAGASARRRRAKQGQHPDHGDKDRTGDEDGTKGGRRANANASHPSAPANKRRRVDKAELNTSTAMKRTASTSGTRTHTSKDTDASHSTLTTSTSTATTSGPSAGPATATGTTATTAAKPRRRAPAGSSSNRRRNNAGLGAGPDASTAMSSAGGGLGRASAQGSPMPTIASASSAERHYSTASPVPAASRTGAGGVGRGVMKAEGGGSSHAGFSARSRPSPAASSRAGAHGRGSIARDDNNAPQDLRHADTPSFKSEEYAQFQTAVPPNAQNGTSRRTGATSSTSRNGNHTGSGDLDSASMSMASAHSAASASRSTRNQQTGGGARRAGGSSSTASSKKAGSHSTHHPVADDEVKHAGFRSGDYAPTRAHRHSAAADSHAQYTYNQAVAAADDARTGFAATDSVLTTGSVDEYTEEDSESEPRYCYCNQVSYGEMVACDKEDCEREWFHLSCVGLAKPPGKSTKWYCNECKEKMRKARSGAR